MSKFKNILLGVLLLVVFGGSLFGLWAFAMNQFTGYLGNQRAAETQSAEQDAIAGCLEFGVPHAIVADNVAWCYMSIYGSEQAIPLEILQAQYSDKEPTIDDSPYKK